MQESLDATGLTTKIATLYAADEAPDLVRYWSGSSMQPYAEAGKLLNLDPYLTEDYLAKIKDGALANYTFNGHVYGLPMGQTSYQLFVNKAMFEAANLELPYTWDALMKAVEYFSAQGVPTIAMSVKYDNGSIAATFIWQLMMDAVGAQAYEQAIKGEIDYASNPQFKEAVERYIDLIEAGAFSDGAVMMDREECEVGVFNGTTPLYYHGSWVVQQYYLDSSTVNPDDIVVMSLPSWDGASGEKNTLSTFGDAFMVSANTKYPEHAAETLKILAYQFGKEVYERGQSASAYILDDPDESNLSALFIQLSEYLQTVNACDAYGAYLDQDGKDELRYALESLQLGQMTADEFIAAIDEIY